LGKQEKIEAFIDAIENIVSSKVVGLDFIALGDDDSYFQDYLLHNKPVSEYLDALASYFKNYPSLLITDLVYQIKGITSKKEVIPHNHIKLNFEDKQIPKDDFIRNNEEGKEDYFWEKWCEIISNFYPYCGSVLFLKLDFEELDQTTALFIYFDNNISDIDTKSEGWLKEKLNVFLYEEAISFFLPNRIERLERKNVTVLVQTTYSLGHNLKNRLLDADRQMSDLIDDLESSSLKDEEKQEIKSYATNVSLKVKSLSNTGKILV
jgi:hypothetical protein